MPALLSHGVKAILTPATPGETWGYIQTPDAGVNWVKLDFCPVSPDV
jgi:hypothetical protein